MAKSGASKDEVYSAYAALETTTQSERDDVTRMEKDNLASQANDSKLTDLKYQENKIRHYVDALSDERMHQAKLVSILTTEGKIARVERLEAKKEEVNSALVDAEGLAVYNNARSLYKLNTKIEKATESSYAKAWTLPMQIWRSILCVLIYHWLYYRNPNRCALWTQ